ncbi:hypothetical protein [Azonexus hydrophilus]|uniref:Uncharacterized protein n=1 Tax=Azonexus hydrophilus TaxID=418702 RepID=A0ABZ2XCU2_9RHOO
MTARHTPAQQYKEAREIARANGMFVVEKPGRFLLYRQCSPRNVYLGYRSDVGEFRRFVESCAGSKKAASH